MASSATSADAAVVAGVAAQVTPVPEPVQIAFTTFIWFR